MNETIAKVVAALTGATLYFPSVVSAQLIAQSYMSNTSGLVQMITIPPIVITLILGVLAVVFVFL